MSINYFHPNLKIQLKARFRIQEFLNSRNKNLNNPKSNSENIMGIKTSKRKQNKNKSIITNFHKYIIKTNLLKKIVSKMSTNELYKKEKDCSIKCDDAIEEIELHQKYFQKLPKIERRKNNLSYKNIKIYKIKTSNRTKEKSNCSDINTAQCQSMPTILSSKKITSDNNDIIKNKENTISSYCRVKRRNNNKLAGIFGMKQNFSIIKGGGIKYNNSIFRNKNMNHLVHLKSL